MINEVTMPSMGADMTEGTIAKWLKAEGDQISRGDKLAEIETDKTVVEMEAYADGVLRRITVEEGSLVQVGTVIAYIGDPEDEIPEAVSDPVLAERDTQPSEQSDASAPAPAPAPARAAPGRAGPAIYNTLASDHAFRLGETLSGSAFAVIYNTLCTSIVQMPLELPALQMTPK